MAHASWRICVSPSILLRRRSRAHYCTLASHQLVQMMFITWPRRRRRRRRWQRRPPWTWLLAALTWQTVLSCRRRRRRRSPAHFHFTGKHCKQPVWPPNGRTEGRTNECARRSSFFWQQRRHCQCRPLVSRSVEGRSGVPLPRTGLHGSESPRAGGRTRTAVGGRAVLPPKYANSSSTPSSSSSAASVKRRAASHVLKVYAPKLCSHCAS